MKLNVLLLLILLSTSNQIMAQSKGSLLAKLALKEKLPYGAVVYSTLQDQKDLVDAYDEFARKDSSMQKILKPDGEFPHCNVISAYQLSDSTSIIIRVEPSVQSWLIIQSIPNKEVLENDALLVEELFEGITNIDSVSLKKVSESLHRLAYYGVGLDRNSEYQNIFSHWNPKKNSDNTSKRKVVSFQLQDVKIAVCVSLSDKIAIKNQSTNVLIEKEQKEQKVKKTE